MRSNVEKVRNAMLSVQRYPWEQGVCMQAMYEAGETDIAVAMAHDAVLRQQPDGRLAVINENIAVTDPASCGICVKKAYEITGDEFYLTGAKGMLEYLMCKAPRTDKGILCHNEISFHEGFSKNQIWVDSIFMAPPFLAEMGEIEEAFNQIKGMYDYLIDEESGLLRHIYDADNAVFVRDKLWATGNGWALLGMALVAEKAGEQKRKDIAQKLWAMSKKLLDNMLVYQLSDGRFHDILNDANSFVDGTGAMMAATYIYRYLYNARFFEKGISWSEAEKYRACADHVVSTMENYVDSYGIIHGVCGCPHFVSEGTSAESMAAYIMMHAWKEKTIP